MTHLDQDALIASLRDRGRGAVPHLGLTAESVLARSRSRRRRRMAAQSMAATVLVIGAVVGVATAIGPDAVPAPPAVPDPSQTPTPLVQVGQGIEAVRDAVPDAAADATQWDTGIRDPWPPGGDRVVLALSTDGDLRSVQLWAASAEERTGEVLRLEVPAAAEGATEPATIAAARAEHPYNGAVLVLGLVPDTANPGSVGVSALLDESGTEPAGQAADLPTFALPGVDGWRVFIASIDPRKADTLQRGIALSVDGGAHVLVTPTCIGSAAECPSAAASGDEPAMCAEFPSATTAVAGSLYEGWWNGTPSAVDGSALEDPADWPPIMREHPRTAQVDTRNMLVLETHDRFTCGSVDSYSIPQGLDLPTNAVVILDIDTSEVLEVYSPPLFEPWTTEGTDP